MADSADIALLPASVLQRRLQRGDLSPADVAEACLRNVERRNGELNAVVTLNERLLAEARQLQRRSSRSKGLLYGLPVGIKDTTAVAGLRTTYGSVLYADRVPREDALVTQRLRAAGALILGKTNTPAFAVGGATSNALFGVTRNPWDTARASGGSTGGGAAALAAGMVTFAEGTDLGGSLRMPASFCGGVGLRPSAGLIPSAPGDHLWDRLSVTGAMGRAAEDIALFLQATGGPSPESPVYQPFEGRDFVGAVRRGPPREARLAYCADVTGVSIEPEIERVCRRSAFEMAQAGAHVEEVAMDLSEGREAFGALRGYHLCATHFRRLDRLRDLGENLATDIRFGLQTSVSALAKAERTRTSIWRVFREFFRRFDYLFTPCMAVSPFSVDRDTPPGREEDRYYEWFAPTFVLSLTGLPIGCVPCGLDAAGLPVGIQIVGPSLGEEGVLALARRIQEACPIGLPAP